MRNFDKIRTLENKNELLRRQVKTLREQNELLDTANLQLRQIADTLIIEIAKDYGEKREEDGKLLGYRLATRKVDVKANLASWDIQVQDQGDKRVIGIFPKEKEDAHGI